MPRMGIVSIWLSLCVLAPLLLIACSTSEPTPTTQAAPPLSATADAATSPEQIQTTGSINVIDDVGLLPLGSILGSGNATATGSDGLAIVSYYDRNGATLKVAHCTNTECSSATISIIDTVGVFGGHSSITIGTDGLALISYYANEGGSDIFARTKAAVRLAHCSNNEC